MANLCGIEKTQGGREVGGRELFSSMQNAPDKGINKAGDRWYSEEMCDHVSSFFYLIFLWSPSIAFYELKSYHCICERATPPPIMISKLCGIVLAVKLISDVFLVTTDWWSEMTTSVINWGLLKRLYNINQDDSLSRCATRWTCTSLLWRGMTISWNHIVR